MFVDVIRGHSPKVTFTINGNEQGYNLTDGIYPSWSVFKKGVTSSTREVLILLSKTINVEERCGVCFQPTEEEV
jgi:hypothetical protein